MDATVDLGALRSLAVAETQGDRFACSEGHETLARLHVQQGAPEDALRHVTAALDIGVELDAPRLLWTALATASSLAQEQGAPEAAARWLAVSESLREALGEDLGPMAAASRDDHTMKLEEVLGSDGLRRTFAAAASLSPQAAVAEVMAWSRRWAAPTQTSRPAPAPVAVPSGHAVIVAATTAREREVLELLARGLTNRQIGDQLVLGVRTVDYHVANLLRKLDAGNRSELAAIAVRAGLGAGRADP